MSDTSTKYLALVPIWHSGEQKDYAAGATVNLAHLTKEQRAFLVEQKVVAPLPHAGDASEAGAEKRHGKK